MVTQCSESLVCLTVYNQHFLIGLKLRIKKLNKTTDNYTRNLNSGEPFEQKTLWIKKMPVSCLIAVTTGTA